MRGFGPGCDAWGRLPAVFGKFLLSKSLAARNHDGAGPILVSLLTITTNEKYLPSRSQSAANQGADRPQEGLWPGTYIGSPTEKLQLDGKNGKDGEDGT